MDPHITRVLQSNIFGSNPAEAERRYPDHPDGERMGPSLRPFNPFMRMSMSGGHRVSPAMPSDAITRTPAQSPEKCSDRNVQRQNAPAGGGKGSSVTINILPSSARLAAFKAIVLLQHPVPYWFIRTLQRTKAIRDHWRLLGTLSRLEDAIATLLSRSAAIWRLATVSMRCSTSTSLASSAVHGSTRRRKRIVVSGHVVHVDFVCDQLMTFKLTDATIDQLWNSFQTFDDSRVHEKRQEDAFRECLGAYIPVVSVNAFSALQKDGSGELQGQYAREIKRRMGDRLRQASGLAASVTR